MARALSEQHRTSICSNHLPSTASSYFISPSRAQSGPENADHGGVQRQPSHDLIFRALGLLGKTGKAAASLLSPVNPTYSPFPPHMHTWPSLAVARQWFESEPGGRGRLSLLSCSPGTCCVDQTGLELIEIPLPLSPKFWD